MPSLSSFRRAALVLILAAVCGTSFAVTARADQPLPMDPSLVTGTLDNGLKYIVRQNALPAGHINIWMHVGSGSLNETDRQRGLAHYLEHLAFNGTQNFPPGQVVPFFESLGLTFGRHQNAFTNFEQTTYQLDLGKPDPEYLQKAMLFMSDVAFRMLLDPKEIDQERQIILNEKMSRSGSGQRIGDYMHENMYAGSLYAKRMTIGLEETIKGAQRPDFEDYYSKYYVPSNITVIVVGDIEPVKVVDSIKANFAEAKKVDKPKGQEPGVKPTDKTRALIATDSELTVANIGITRIIPGRPPTTTEAGYRTELLERIADFAFARRTQNRVAAGKAAFYTCSLGVGDIAQTVLQTRVSASGKPDQWRQVLAQAATELQRARLHGFSDQELADARTSLISSAEQSIKTEPSLKSANLVSRYNNAVTQNEPILSAQQRLDLLNKLLPTITAPHVSEHFAALYDPSVVVFTATLPTTADVPSEEELIKVGTAALNVKPEKEADLTRAERLIEKLPAPGKVVDQTTHAASGVESFWLDNGARVHYRFMDIQKDDVSISISLAGGQINETAANRGITQAAQTGIAGRSAATKHLSSTQLRQLFEGKNVRVGGIGGGGGGGGGGRGGRGGGGGGGGLDTVNLSVSGSPTDLELGMQLAYLLLTEPKIEEVAFNRSRDMLKQFMPMRLTTAAGVLGEELTNALYPKDEVRTRVPTEQQLDAITIEAAQKWLEDIITTSPIEVSIVGDIPKDRAMTLVTTYVGSLPKRERISADIFKDKRTIAKPDKPIMIDRELVTQTDQAQVVAGIFGADAANRRDVRVMSMAAQIITSRMVKAIREDKQLVYSISAQSVPSETFPGFGQFVARAPTKPGKAAELSKAVYDIFDEFAKSGPTAEEMDTARKQRANTIDEQMKEPGFWSGQLSNLDFRGRNLDEILETATVYGSLTADDIRSTFSKYNLPEKRINVRVTPAPKSEADKAAPVPAPATPPNG